MTDAANPWVQPDSHLVPASAFLSDGLNAQLHPVRLSLSDEDGVRALVLRREGHDPMVWSMAGLRGIPDQAARDATIVTHIDAPLARLMITGSEARAVIKQHAPNLKRRPPVNGLGRILGWAGAAIASVVLIVFVLVPSMANTLAPWLPPQGEKALGDATYSQIRDALSESDLIPIEVCEDPAGLAALDKMRMALAEQANLPYELTLSVLDHKMINAFALPGGRIVFFRGLIDNATKPEEVAAVLAHEMGHVESRDPTRHALRSAGSFGVLGLLFGDFAGGTAVLLLVNQLVDASYSQNAEAGADTYAHRVLRGAGVSPGHIATFFERLKAKSGEPEGIVKHLLSHPAMGDRIAAARAAPGPDTERPILTRDEWAALQQVCR